MPYEALRILIVDDDPLVARALERGLRRHHAIVETNSEAAYQRLLRGEWFDAVLCDVTMPEINGHVLLATARALPDPPVFVMMSGEDVCDTNADAILHKPFSVHSLLDLLGMLSRQRAIATTQPLPRAGTP